jgi:hypothetical protein
MKILGDVVPAGLVGALFVLSALTGAYAQDAANERAAGPLQVPSFAVFAEHDMPR